MYALQKKTEIRELFDSAQYFISPLKWDYVLEKLQYIEVTQIYWNPQQKRRRYG